MMTMSQVVHGTAPAATGDGGESRGGRHTALGTEQQGLGQAPNTGGTLWRQEPSSCNAPSRFARDVGGRHTTSRKVEFVGVVVVHFPLQC